MAYDQNEIYEDLETEPESAPEMMLRQIRMLMGDIQQLRFEAEDLRAQMRRTRIETMMTLAKTAEIKEINTVEQLQRIGHIAVLIAKYVGLKSDVCDHMFYAAQMHDIGKIGVPDSVLKKKGALSDAEWASMRQHPEIGAALLAHSGTENCELLSLAQEIALTHHEKFDGTGYPHGLSGSEIPISGRIVAIADFFDALTTDRNYRPAFSREDALKQLYAQSGKAFDPAIINAFKEAYTEIIETGDRLHPKTELIGGADAFHFTR